jgi:hypothetical protein
MRNVIMMDSVTMERAVIVLIVQMETMMIQIIVRIDFDVQKMNLNLLAWRLLVVRLVCDGVVTSMLVRIHVVLTYHRNSRHELIYPILRVMPNLVRHTLDIRFLRAHSRILLDYISTVPLCDILCHL